MEGALCYEFCDQAIFIFGRLRGRILEAMHSDEMETIDDGMKDLLPRAQGLSTISLLGPSFPIREHSPSSYTLFPDQYFSSSKTAKSTTTPPRPLLIHRSTNISHISAPLCGSLLTSALTLYPVSGSSLPSTRVFKRQSTEGGYGASDPGQYCKF